MSTFSGLGTALSSLIAQRQALDVAGQNVANANTVGYTRQRASLSALPSANVPSMFSVNNGAGEGVRVTGIERLGDVFLDLRLRTQTAGASYLSARAEAYGVLEKSLGEPGETGLASQLATMWGAWSDLSNTPDKNAARAVVLQDSKAVADRIASLYTSVQTQWTQARTTTAGLVEQVNTTAAGVADLNARILEITNAGGTANELMDRRDQLVTQLSSLVGASTTTRENGQVDVLVGGNALVSGKRVHELAVTGAASFAQATAGQAVTVVWAERPTQSAGLDGGLGEHAARYDALATTIADQVNTLHGGAVTADGRTTGDFWTFQAGRPAALGLTVAITSAADVAVADPTKGPLDGTVGDAIAALKTSQTGPDAHWSSTVVDLGVRASSASSRAKVAESARATAEQQQLAATSVDTDEETVNMLAFQRAYEGAARVLTAVDQMLDVLINKTGLVGR
ncbi:flagellar hook-associated protein FlgK [Cellulomonas septica]|uniref:Flagellar hook-associated protein 1 n=1 Tax=Cellulomonas septica TaxID=285080 RepID=A0ABX1JYV1_9CELL|nr:flagellar hook-associated protein FlgK [Cellulomonas septica]NKY38925.1 flagellar hook-associated protein FlgK [Cellulomonas septica]